MAAPWGGHIAAVEDGRVALKETHPERFVGVPGMSALARHLADSLDIDYRTRVAMIEQRDRRWRRRRLPERHGSCWSHPRLTGVRLWELKLWRAIVLEPL